MGLPIQIPPFLSNLQAYFHSESTWDKVAPDSLKYSPYPAHQHCELKLPHWWELQEPNARLMQPYDMFEAFSEFIAAFSRGVWGSLLFILR